MTAIFIRRGPWGWIQALDGDPPEALATIAGLEELASVLGGEGARLVSRPLPRRRTVGRRRQARTGALPAAEEPRTAFAVQRHRGASIAAAAAPVGRADRRGRRSPR